MTTASNSQTTSGGRKPLIVIVGETGSGKSTLAMELAEAIDGEIIAADSRTIYKGMDIGTSKPTTQEQKRVRHHLLDVVEPGQPFSAADFKRLAEAAVSDIRDRGKQPIMVGGSGLYVDSILFDYQFRTKYDAAIRRTLAGKTLDELIKLALEQGFKPEQIDKNRRHLIRLLEAGPTRTSDRDVMIPNTVIVGLRPSRAQLRQNIVSRVELMFRRGLRREVDELVKAYGWENEAMSGIGYREFEDHYFNRASIGQVKRSIVQHTLELAKRQRTWFKRNPAIRWFDEPSKAKRFILSQV